MELFRSESMQLVQFIVPAEAAHDTVLSLGEIGLVQFKDMNPSKSGFQRTYYKQVKRCEEMLRKLRYFGEQMVKAGLIPMAQPAPDQAYTLDELEAKLDDLESELRQITDNTEKLRRGHSELVELQIVLEKAGGFFEPGARSGSVTMSDGIGMLGGASGGSLAQDEETGGVNTALLGTPARGMGGDNYYEMQQDPESIRLGFICGVLPTQKTPSFERILFRATRGNMYLKHSAIDGKIQDPATGEMVEKTVYVVFFAGERARAKILKICEGFGANRYPFPEDFSRQRQMNAEVTARLGELQETLDASIRHRNAALSSIGHHHELWTTLVRREKAIYHTLNMFSIDVTRKCLVAEGWIPVAAKPRIQDALFRANRASSAQMGTVFQPINTDQAPPTYFPTNKVTAVFQGIVEAYGVGRYREVNPTVFTIVTFPFLFAVMFGDFGHGVLMLLAALYLVYNEKKLGKIRQQEIMQMMFDGRYCILLMAIFSIYTGLLYNECFSVPMNWFGTTKWTGCDPKNTSAGDQECTYGGVYAFGVDPIWHGTKTELPFLNSLKMKMSIIMGVTQMMLGIFMSLLNFLYTRDFLSIVCEFIPQVIFLGSLFGYLVILMIMKWTTPGATADLYHVMIYMFLAPGNADCAGEGANGEPGCPENVMFWGQGGFQVFLVLIALASVPVMLFPKPLILKRRWEVRQRGEFYTALDDHLNVDGSLDDHVHGDHGFDFSETLVHQMIHTIEFVLGAVSNTASYLRLWALSLAHAQLSAVFWDRVFMAAVATQNPVAMVVGFAVWASATIGVLMLMESLSAFLHALRLHWVEYQNKFYRGDGYKFAPFSLAEILKPEASEYE